MNEEVSFDVQVVSEFPAMVAIVMAVLMMIVAIAKLSDKTVPKMS
ncbi:MAG: hypothetical protein ACRD32_08260 [Nitrososphaerales archaeon]